MDNNFLVFAGKIRAEPEQLIKPMYFKKHKLFQEISVVQICGFESIYVQTLTRYY